MSRLELRPFADEHLDAAAELLAERHRRHRVAEPTLPARFEDPAAAREEIEAAWRRDGASGAAAFVEGRLAGYLVGAPDDEAHWGGPNVWVGHAGHAAVEPELVRDLYGLAADRWVEERRPRHYVQVPASERGLLEAWYRVCFGQQHAAGVVEVPDVRWPAGVREATPDEVEARLAGGFTVAPAELAGDGPHAFAGLARPERAAYLAWAATLPEVRGSGVGVALTDAAFAWARRAGYETMVTDWRVTNLLSSRFWPRRGFRTTFLRLYRSIP